MTGDCFIFDQLCMFLIKGVNRFFRLHIAVRPVPFSSFTTTQQNREQQYTSLRFQCYYIRFTHLYNPNTWFWMFILIITVLSRSHLACCPRLLPSSALLYCKPFIKSLCSHSNDVVFYAPNTLGVKFMYRSSILYHQLSVSPICLCLVNDTCADLDVS